MNLERLIGAEVVDRQGYRGVIVEVNAHEDLPLGVKFELDKEGIWWCTLNTTHPDKSCIVQPVNNSPYLQKTITQAIKVYNPYYGDYRKCECGHHYYRHFDTYDEMAPVGCKYCGCDEFREAVE